jgi:Protein of unknown function (DUF565)
MQNTRLTTLLDDTLDRLGGWLRNPWRRLSVLIISLLFGNFLGPAISTITGQQAQLDVVVAAVLLAGTELVSWVVYRPRGDRPRSLVLAIPNAIKMGLIYSLFVEALKLGS